MNSTLVNYLCGNEASALPGCFLDVTAETISNILFVISVNLILSAQLNRNARHRSENASSSRVPSTAELAAMSPSERILSVTEFQWFVKCGLVGSLITTNAVNLFYQILGQLEFPLGIPDASSALLESLPGGAYLVGGLSVTAYVLCFVVLMKSSSTVRILPHLPIWWCLKFIVAIVRVTSTVSLSQLGGVESGAILLCANVLLLGALSIFG
eukprot:9470779-Pyramimonas_sp.AAC.1